MKERHYRLFLQKINKTNGVYREFPTATFPPYKYFIQKGNNSQVVRAALKTRFWWSLGPEYGEWEDYNFTWTQWKNNRIINGLKTWKEFH